MANFHGEVVSALPPVWENIFRIAIIAAIPAVLIGLPVYGCRDRIVTWPAWIFRWFRLRRLARRRGWTCAVESWWTDGDPPKVVASVSGSHSGISFTVKHTIIWASWPGSWDSYSIARHETMASAVVPWNLPQGKFSISPNRGRGGVKIESDPQMQSLVEQSGLVSWAAEKQIPILQVHLGQGMVSISQDKAMRKRVLFSQLEMLSDIVQRLSGAHGPQTRAWPGHSPR
jgi:hypothetical protein